MLPPYIPLDVPPAVFAADDAAVAAAAAVRHVTLALVFAVVAAAANADALGAALLPPLLLVASFDAKVARVAFFVVNWVSNLVTEVPCLSVAAAMVVSLVWLAFRPAAFLLLMSV